MSVVGLKHFRVLMTDGQAEAKSDDRPPFIIVLIKHMHNEQETKRWQNKRKRQTL